MTKEMMTTRLSSWQPTDQNDSNMPAIPLGNNFPSERTLRDTLGQLNRHSHIAKTKCKRIKQLLRLVLTRETDHVPISRLEEWKRDAETLLERYTVFKRFATIVEKMTHNKLHGVTLATITDLTEVIDNTREMMDLIDTLRNDPVDG